MTPQFGQNLAENTFHLSGHPNGNACFPITKSHEFWVRSRQASWTSEPRYTLKRDLPSLSATIQQHSFHLDEHFLEGDNASLFFLAGVEGDDDDKVEEESKKNQCVHCLTGCILSSYDSGRAGEVWCNNSLMV